MAICEAVGIPAVSPAPVLASINAMHLHLDQIEAHHGTKNSRKKRARAFTGE